LVYVV